MNDIPDLYRRFDGDASNYQELRRSDLAAEATARWPLIAAMTSTPRVPPPAVRPHVLPSPDAPSSVLPAQGGPVGLAWRAAKRGNPG